MPKFNNPNLKVVLYKSNVILPAFIHYSAVNYPLRYIDGWNIDVKNYDRPNNGVSERTYKFSKITLTPKPKSNYSNDELLGQLKQFETKMKQFDVSKEEAKSKGAQPIFSLMTHDQLIPSEKIHSKPIDGLENTFIENTFAMQFIERLDVYLSQIEIEIPRAQLAKINIRKSNVIPTRKDSENELVTISLLCLLNAEPMARAKLFQFPEFNSLADGNDAKLLKYVEQVNFAIQQVIAAQIEYASLINLREVLSKNPINYSELSKLLETVKLPQDCDFFVDKVNNEAKNLRESVRFTNDDETSIAVEQFKKSSCTTESKPIADKYNPLLQCFEKIVNSNLISASSSAVTPKSSVFLHQHYMAMYAQLEQDAEIAWTTDCFKLELNRLNRKAEEIKMSVSDSSAAIEWDNLLMNMAAYEETAKHKFKEKFKFDNCTAYYDLFEKHIDTNAKTDDAIKENIKAMKTSIEFKQARIEIFDRPIKAVAIKKQCKENMMADIDALIKNQNDDELQKYLSADKYNHYKLALCDFVNFFMMITVVPMAIKAIMTGSPVFSPVPSSVSAEKAGDLRASLRKVPTFR